MGEHQARSEDPKTLSKAVSETIDAYMGDLIGIELEQTTEERDEIWTEIANDNPAYADKIRELREVRKGVEATKKRYPFQAIQSLGSFFHKVEDEITRSYLIDILLSRITKSVGYMDYPLHSVDEVKKMREELGIQGGLRSDELKGLTMEKVVGVTLTGALRITYQPSPQGWNPPLTRIPR